MEEQRNNMIMLGQRAPRFIANSTFGPLKLTDYMGKWLVFFSHPGDFTTANIDRYIIYKKVSLFLFHLSIYISQKSLLIYFFHTNLTLKTY